MKCDHAGTEVGSTPRTVGKRNKTAINFALGQERTQTGNREAGWKVHVSQGGEVLQKFSALPEPPKFLVATPNLSSLCDSLKSLKLAFPTPGPDFHIGNRNTER